MLRDFAEVFARVKALGSARAAVAVAQDEHVLEAVCRAREMGIIAPVLIGDQQGIEDKLAAMGLAVPGEIIHEPDAITAARKAVALTRSWETGVLVKGLINTGDFLRCVLEKDVGLRMPGRIISHLAALENDRDERVIFFTDTGINIAPDLQEKKKILDNAIEALGFLGYPAPKIAVMAANEIVSEKMPVTVDAQALSEWYAADASFAGVVEGPCAMDVAVSRRAAEHKGIASRVAGETDIFLFPTVEAGNLTSKALIHYANFRMGGVLLGAQKPIVVTSRNDDAETKLYSIALACLLSYAEKACLLFYPEK